MLSALVPIEVTFLPKYAGAARDLAQEAAATILEMLHPLVPKEVAQLIGNIRATADVAREVTRFSNCACSNCACLLSCCYIRRLGNDASIGHLLQKATVPQKGE
eukprot:gnl/TRDRNA2_/TRDRNA2_133836_c0_seq1.p2 gnl/TRDRNA2_/TRDRNA2_133836_c0~~gnl/TRDRNA2_/TRDRNA2_133836_c0_seq1.p2  ORF type:complete len:104 (+),score=13.60 gnl/TRDRNA2_/TRDRNA2_133836_c0_seq1:263-574(+)